MRNALRASWFTGFLLILSGCGSASLLDFERPGQREDIDETVGTRDRDLKIYDGNSIPRTSGRIFLSSVMQNVFGEIGEFIQVAQAPASMPFRPLEELILYRYSEHGTSCDVYEDGSARAPNPGVRNLLDHGTRLRNNPTEIREYYRVYASPQGSPCFYSENPSWWHSPIVPTTQLPHIPSIASQAMGLRMQFCDVILGSSNTHLHTAIRRSQNIADAASVAAYFADLTISDAEVQNVHDLFFPGRILSSEELSVVQVNYLQSIAQSTSSTLTSLSPQDRAQEMWRFLFLIYCQRPDLVLP